MILRAGLLCYNEPGRVSGETGAGLNENQVAGEGIHCLIGHCALPLTPA